MFWTPPFSIPYNEAHILSIINANPPPHTYLVNCHTSHFVTNLVIINYWIESWQRKCARDPKLSHINWIRMTWLASLNESLKKLRMETFFLYTNIMHDRFSGFFIFYFQFLVFFLYILFSLTFFVINF